MPPEVLILFFGTLLGLGGIILLGQRMRYRYLEGDDAREEVKRLAENMSALADEVGQLQSEVTGLTERLEFTERLLARPVDGEFEP